MVRLGFNLPIQAGGRAAAADEASASRAKYESDASRLEASARTEVYVSLKKPLIGAAKAASARARVKP